MMSLKKNNNNNLHTMATKTCFSNLPQLNPIESWSHRVLGKALVHGLGNFSPLPQSAFLCWPPESLHQSSSLFFPPIFLHELCILYIVFN